MIVRLPVEPTRHRVAVWRELRRAGALSLGQGVWALPSTPAFGEAVERATKLVERGEGEVVLLDAVGRDEANAARLEAQFTAAREAEWAEFLAECAKYESELADEVAKRKFTLAELDEEEQSLERLRRWYRELKLRDVFGAPSGSEADSRLKECTEKLEAFADLVYGAVHQP
jgi:Protein ChrB, N-terminal